MPKNGGDPHEITLPPGVRPEGRDDTDKGGANNIMLTKRVTENRYVPVITSLFNTQRICLEDDPMMPWYVNNACVITDRGNQYYGKKEEKSRKTDGFKAMVAAICASENLADSGEESGLDDFKVPPKCLHRGHSQRFDFLWLADYSGRPDVPCAIQQTASSGTVPGISGSVDIDTVFAEIGAPPIKCDTTTDVTRTPGGWYQFKVTAEK